MGCTDRFIQVSAGDITMSVKQMVRESKGCLSILGFSCHGSQHPQRAWHQQSLLTHHPHPSSSKHKLGPWRGTNPRGRAAVTTLPWGTHQCSGVNHLEPADSWFPIVTCLVSYYALDPAQMKGVGEVCLRITDMVSMTVVVGFTVMVQIACLTNLPMAITCDHWHLDGWRIDWFPFFLCLAVLVTVKQ
jgi:hypothetical protein